jgi:hypothetical protein
VDHGAGLAHDVAQLDRHRLRECIHGDRQGVGLEVMAAAGEELAVPGREDLRLECLLVLMQFLADHRAADRPGRSVDGGPDPFHGHLLERDTWDVLGAVDVAHLRVAGHDHRRRSVQADPPGPVGGLRDPVQVVHNVLTEVPDGPVVRLGVQVDRHLRDAAVQVGAELRLQRLDPAAVPRHHLGVRQQRGLDLERHPLDFTEDDGVQLSDREQRVGDPGRVGERRKQEIDPSLVRSQPLPGDPVEGAQVGLRDRQQVTGRRDDRADPGAGTGRVSRGIASAPAQPRGDDEPGGKCPRASMDGHSSAVLRRFAISLDNDNLVALVESYVDRRTVWLGHLDLPGGAVLRVALDRVRCSTLCRRQGRRGGACGLRAGDGAFPVVVRRDRGGGSGQRRGNHDPSGDGADHELPVHDCPSFDGGCGWAAAAMVALPA